MSLSVSNKTSRSHEMSSPAPCDRHCSCTFKSSLRLVSDLVLTGAHHPETIEHYARLRLIHSYCLVSTRITPTCFLNGAIYRTFLDCQPCLCLMVAYVHGRSSAIDGWGAVKWHVNSSSFYEGNAAGWAICTFIHGSAAIIRISRTWKCALAARSRAHTCLMQRLGIAFFVSSDGSHHPRHDRRNKAYFLGVHKCAHDRMMEFFSRQAREFRERNEAFLRTSFVRARQSQQRNISIFNVQEIRISESRSRCHEIDHSYKLHFIHFACGTRHGSK